MRVGPSDVDSFLQAVEKEDLVVLGDQVAAGVDVNALNKVCLCVGTIA